MATRMYLCERSDEDPHCTQTCLCGAPHKADGCTAPEYCFVIADTVRCKPISKRELNKWKNQKHQ